LDYKKHKITQCLKLPVVRAYQQQQYRLGDAIFSPLFPNLKLKLDDIMP
jgi:Uma2 family endonuclease